MWWEVYVYQQSTKHIKMNLKASKRISFHIIATIYRSNTSVSDRDDCLQPASTNPNKAWWRKKKSTELLSHTPLHGLVSFSHFPEPPDSLLFTCCRSVLIFFVPCCFLLFLLLLFNSLLQSCVCYFVCSKWSLIKRWIYVNSNQRSGCVCFEEKPHCASFWEVNIIGYGAKLETHVALKYYLTGFMIIISNLWWNKGIF